MSKYSFSSIHLEIERLVKSIYCVIKSSLCVYRIKVLFNYCGIQQYALSKKVGNDVSVTSLSLVSKMTIKLYVEKS